MWHDVVSTSSQEHLGFCSMPGAVSEATPQKKLKHVLFRSISRDCFIQNKITWEPGLWSSSSHSQMMLTQHWFALSFVFFFLPHGCQGHGCRWGRRKGRGRKLWKLFTKKRAVLCWPLGKSSGSWPPSGFAVGRKAQPAPHSWPAQAHGILATSSSLLLRDVGPNPTLVHPAPLLGERRSSRSPDAGLGFRPRNQPLSIKTKPN